MIRTPLSRGRATRTRKREQLCERTMPRQSFEKDWRGVVPLGVFHLVVRVFCCVALLLRCGTLIRTSPCRAGPLRLGTYRRFSLSRSVVSCVACSEHEKQARCCHQEASLERLPFRSSASLLAAEPCTLSVCQVIGSRPACHSPTVRTCVGVRQASSCYWYVHSCMWSSFGKASVLLAIAPAFDRIAAGASGTLRSWGL